MDLCHPYIGWASSCLSRLWEILLRHSQPKYSSMKKAMHCIAFLALWCHATDVTVRPNHSTIFKACDNHGCLLWLQLLACCLLEKLPDLPCAEDLASSPQQSSGIGTVSCFNFAPCHLSPSPCILAVWTLLSRFYVFFFSLRPWCHLLC